LCLISSANCIAEWPTGKRFKYKTLIKFACG
jgi:hypothetical protein